MVNRSTPRAATSTGTLPTAWAASLCTGMPCLRAQAAISATGCRAPVSLLASMTEMRSAPEAQAARTAAGSTRPCSSTPTRLTRAPQRSR